MGTARAGSLNTPGSYGWSRVIGRVLSGFVSWQPQIPQVIPSVTTPRTGALQIRAVGGGSPRIAGSTFGITRSGGYLARKPHGYATRFVANATAPALSNVAPSAGTTIYPSTTIYFTVTDAAPLVLFEISMDQIGGREVVWDGSGFVLPYQGSQRTAVTNGWTYSVTRLGGWNVAPSFYLTAFDANLGQLYIPHS